MFWAKMEEGEAMIYILCWQRMGEVTILCRSKLKLEMATRRCDGRNWSIRGAISRNNGWIWMLVWMAKEGGGEGPWQRDQSFGRFMLMGVKIFKLYKQPQFGWYWDICSLRNEWAWLKGLVDGCTVGYCTLIMCNSNKHLREKRMKWTLKAPVQPGKRLMVVWSSMEGRVIGILQAIQRLCL